MPEPGVIYLADHSFVLALPAFGPAVVVAVVVLFLAMRDQRRRNASPPREDAEAAGREGGDP